MKKMLCIFSFLTLMHAALAEVIDVPIGGEVTQTVYWAQPNAVATLIFLPGGNGSFNIASRNPQRPNWILYGLYRSTPPIDVVFFDSPYSLGLSNLQPRRTKDHLARLLSVIEYYRAKNNLPIFLIGHSNGAVSVAEFLNQDPKNQSLVKGVIMSGSRNETDVDIKLNLPVLILHHREDPNQWTQPKSAQALFERVKKENLSITDIAYVTGGQDESGPPETSGRHMYAGAVDEASDIVKKFIMSNLK